jgi:hypothetical protein
MTYAIWQARSLLPSVLVHLATNTIALLSSYDPAASSVFGIYQDGIPGWPQFLAFATLLSVGLRLLAGEKPATTSSPSQAPARKTGYLRRATSGTQPTASTL